MNREEKTLIINGVKYGPIRRFLFNLPEARLKNIILSIILLFLFIVLSIIKISLLDLYKGEISYNFLSLGLISGSFLFLIIIYPLVVKYINPSRESMYELTKKSQEQQDNYRPLILSKEEFKDIVINQEHWLENSYNLPIELKEKIYNNKRGLFKYLNNPTLKIIQEEIKRKIEDIRYDKRQSRDQFENITKEEEQYLINKGFFSINTNFDLYGENELREIYITIKSGRDKMDDFKRKVFEVVELKDIKNYLNKMKRKH